MDQTTPVIFEEVQQFRQPWLKALLIVGAVLSIGLYGWGFYTQFFLGEPWGSHPMSNPGLAGSGVIAIAFWLGIGLLFACAKLIVRVTKDSLAVRFVPFHLSFQKISLTDVRAVEDKTYSPIKDYGGWGIRYGKGGKAYNVSGNRGVLLTFHTGKTLLIGSQKANELAAALRSMMVPRQ